MVNKSLLTENPLLIPASPQNPLIQAIIQDSWLGSRTWAQTHSDGSSSKLTPLPMPHHMYLQYNVSSIYIVSTPEHQGSTCTSSQPQENSHLRISLAPQAHTTWHRAQVKQRGIGLSEEEGSPHFGQELLSCLGEIDKTTRPVFHLDLQRVGKSDIWCFVRHPRFYRRLGLVCMVFYEDKQRETTCARSAEMPENKKMRVQGWTGRMRREWSIQEEVESQQINTVHIYHNLS